MTSATAFEGWTILELMGHRQRVGWVQEVEMYGGKMLRITARPPTIVPSARALGALECAANERGGLLVAPLT